MTRIYGASVVKGQFLGCGVPAAYLAIVLLSPFGLGESDADERCEVGVPRQLMMKEFRAIASAPDHCILQYVQSACTATDPSIMRQGIRLAGARPTVSMARVLSCYLGDSNPEIFNHVLRILRRRFSCQEIRESLQGNGRDLRLRARAEKVPDVDLTMVIGCLGSDEDRKALISIQNSHRGRPARVDRRIRDVSFDLPLSAALASLGDSAGIRRYRHYLRSGTAEETVAALFLLRLVGVENVRDDLIAMLSDETETWLGRDLVAPPLRVCDFATAAVAEAAYGNELGVSKTVLQARRSFPVRYSSTVRMRAAGLLRRSAPRIGQEE